MRVRPTIVVLAAGQGSRFHVPPGPAAAGPSPVGARDARPSRIDAKGPSHKLEQSLGDGTVLAQTLGHAIETGCPVVVVTSAALVPLATTMVARRDLVVLSDAEAARGIGHSIATGVGERPGAPGWLVLPGDMPLVRPATMLAVADALDEHAVAFPQHRGRRGHPVGFGAELYSELIALDGDEGARRIVARFPSHAVEVDDPGVLFDVDTREDLAAAREASAETTPPGA